MYNGNIWVYIIYTIYYIYHFVIFAIVTWVLETLFCGFLDIFLTILLQLLHLSLSITLIDTFFGKELVDLLFSSYLMSNG